ncbi:DUF1573 domain-containing protein, partial [Candidatus Sumerlaeota bacterium]|nr:DUF1573 domain-containing protein [Candidatus Sumerlaeota bacterium]
IVCDEPVWEFEKVVEGKDVLHSFIIKNQGDETLNIENIRGSCGCTVAKSEKKVLEPGEQTEIKTTFNTAGRVGKQSKYIYVHTNDPENKMFKLTISGEIEKMPAPRIIFSPPSWNMQSIDSESTRETNLNISNTGDRPLEIKAVKASTEQIKTNFSGPVTLKPQEKMPLHIVFTPDIMASTIREKIIISSNDPKRGEAIFNIYGSLNIDNRGINLCVLKVLEEGEENQIELYIRNNETYPLSFKAPEAKEPNTIVVQPKNVKRLSLTVPGNQKEENPENPGKTNQASSNLKMEISVPLQSIQRSTVKDLPQSAPPSKAEVTLPQEIRKEAP